MSHNAVPYAAQFGGMATQMTNQFTKLADMRKAQEGSAYGGAMGGAAGIAAGVTTAATSAVTGAMNIANIDRSTIQGRKDTASEALNMGAGIASAAGPWGAVAAAPLMLVSALLKIKGPRQKRQERRQARRERTQGAIEQSAQENMQGPNANRSAGLSLNPITTVPVGEPPTSFNPQPPVPGSLNG